jgi:FAD synthetase
MSTADELVAMRVLKYIMAVEQVLSNIRLDDVKHPEVREVINLSKAYLNDSKYYFSSKDYITSLSCIAYAEGLLDALRILGIINFYWERPKVRKVMVGGTFDIIHPGHIHYLSEASKLGLVYAVVARDSTVRRIKGKEPVNDELTRLEVVNSLKFVYSAVLGNEENIFKSIEVVKPDVILLGPDQPVDEQSISKYLDVIGLKAEVLRLSSRYKSEIASTTNIINKILKLYCGNYIMCK